MVLAVFVRVALAVLFVVGSGLCLAENGPTELWAHRYSGLPSGRGNALVHRIVSDSDGSVIVAVTTSDAMGATEVVLIKYSGVDGAVLWSLRYDSPGRLRQQFGGLAVDSAGDVFITGSAFETMLEGEAYTAKYSGRDGRLLWE